MRTKSIKTFTATITIGLEIGYTKENYSKEYLINELQGYQKQRIDESGVYLSAFIFIKMNQDSLTESHRIFIFILTL